jgi:murein DD-endopeptidase MepM/ murein hydrolase activator NlpD
LFGGLALVVTGIGAAAADHLLTTDHHTASHGAATVDAAAGASSDAGSSGRASLTTDRRESHAVSRSDARPPLTAPGESTRTVGTSSPGSTRDWTDPSATDPSATDPTRAATRAAALRSASLLAADTRAESYAKVLKSDTWVLPTSGFHITEWFGDPGPYWATGYHTGIDFATAYGTPVVAVQDATVFQTGWDGPYGNQIRLQFTNGDQVWYNHLSAIEVHKGEKVTKGEQLGRVGETGNAYGYHLHFEYRLAKDLTLAVDPRPFFAAHGIILHGPSS